MAKYVLAAISNPNAGREAECGVWYDDVHLADMVKIPGIKNARRLEVLRSAPSKAFKRYLALYEFEADDDASATKLIETINAAQVPLSDALDVSSVNLAIFGIKGAVHVE